jgi:hypothetical protein
MRTRKHAGLTRKVLMQSLLAGGWGLESVFDGMPTFEKYGRRITIDEVYALVTIRGEVRMLPWFQTWQHALAIQIRGR